MRALHHTAQVGTEQVAALRQQLDEQGAAVKEAKAAAAAAKEDKELAAASKAAVDRLLKLKEELKAAEEAWVASLCWGCVRLPRLLAPACACCACLRLLRLLAPAAAAPAGCCASLGGGCMCVLHSALVEGAAGR
jgi:hypothetical protein